jgi:type IV secretion system protein VirB10
MIPRIPIEEEQGDEPASRPVWKRPRVVMAAAVVVAIIVYVLSPAGKNATHRGNTGGAKDAFIGQVAAYEPVMPDTPPTPAPTTPLPPRDLPQGAPTGTIAPPPLQPHPTGPPPPLPPSMRSMMDPGGPGAAPPHPKMLVYALPPAEKVAAPAEPTETSIGFKPATLPGSKASPAIDETFMLLPGLLPLVLDTAIQSDLPGPLLAHLPGPVYSSKGVLLMEAGTQIIGRYETMKQNAGSRLLATSVFAHTPNGIWVPLAGEQLADDLGRTGLDGEVDNHYLQRFGAAILLTLTDQVLQIVQTEASKNGQTYLNLNSGGGGGGGSGGVSSLAQTILQSQINIPPTFSKHQGESMALFLDQPIDFSSSYHLRTVGFKQ